MLVHSRLAHSRVNGPGNRAVIWFQGCSLGCPGCWNPKTHSFERGIFEDPKAVAAWILGTCDIQGVTFSGGEPMQQAPSLLQVMEIVHKTNPTLSFGLFTGYTEKELGLGKYRYISQWASIDGKPTEVWMNEDRPQPTFWERIRSRLDFAVVGRYVESRQSSSRPMCGSSNQELLLLSTRFRSEDFAPQAVEVHIRRGGRVQITGFPIGLKL